MAQPVAAVEQRFNPRQKQEWVLKYSAEPTVSQFHRSEAYLKGIRGPVGSGKSSGCVVEMLRLARMQPPDGRGVRKTLWIAIRNTYVELKTTTIRTFHEWVPEELCYTRDDAPITREFSCDLGDGTSMKMEVFFISCDRPADVGKLKSINASGIWINEASEIAKEILDMATTRIGRFPPAKEGGCRWPVVLLDTNSMDDDHWYYHLDVDKDFTLLKELQEILKTLGITRPLAQFYTQPPAMLEVNGSYQLNPLAENVKNLPMGAAYYVQIIANKSKAWVDMYVLNKYGRVVDGKPVYPEWDEAFHGKKRKLTPIPNLEIGIGMDFGLSPAAAPCQLSPTGQLMVLGEVCAVERSMGLEQFIQDALKPYLANRWGRRFQYYVIGDPNGNRRSDSNEGYCFQVLEDNGFECRAALTNVYYPRREAVAHFLRGHHRGEPNILFDESCKLIPAGLAGRYHYRRVQVAGDEPRYQDEPYKNKWSHPVEALQYVAMEFTGVAEEQKPVEEAQPDWMRRVMTGVDLDPWRTRAGGRRI